MERREFVKSALVTAGVSAAPRFAAQPDGKTPAEPQREFYQFRTYTLRNGPQTALTQRYFETALIPALNRLEMSPIGAFKLDIGPETPTYYVLIPSASAEALISLDTRLGSDAEYVKAASGFRDAPATAPAFVRSERSLLSAFAGWPKIVSPNIGAKKNGAPQNGKRIFQLRTYESPSQVAHARKIQMFNEAEIAMFTRTGLRPVFFADTVIGTRMPSLTYMLTFADTAELTEKWAAFSADTAWHELSRRPGNTDAEIVSNISNLYLSPLSCSQI